MNIHCLLCNFVNNITHFKTKMKIWEEKVIVGKVDSSWFGKETLLMDG